ncbi:putative uncharacterized protein DDB_G0282499 [Lucilia cuprina]|uniref:putative uncharacterized protein DDB_G0282499 n=1 Tax=Lucilia cuprina TaxID=7375 RepID=UPI001F05B2A0|nr:putative uncharacterized protein DDB_G0282499 [Lucilia cuprina]
MGVRFFDKENMSNGDDYNSSVNASSNNTNTTRSATCNCNVCSQTRAATAAATTTAATQTCDNSSTPSDNASNLNFQKSGILREIIGNCKEVRIEDNVHNLRIVGNNNRIRISYNVGDITVIGNNTRLKIKINHGLIKYTGNDGRICLGKDSTEQLVDYSGCNGVLKVQNSKKNTAASQVNVDDDDEEAKNNSTSTGTTFINGNFNKNSKNPKQKYAFSDSEVFKCKTDYQNMFSRKKSLPNMSHTKPIFRENQTANRGPQMPKSIIHNFGNIVIANSSNICITPQTYNY